MAARNEMFWGSLLVGLLGLIGLIGLLGLLGLHGLPDTVVVVGKNTLMDEFIWFVWFVWFV
jgi:hypothetical protein